MLTNADTRFRNITTSTRKTAANTLMNIPRYTATRHPRCWQNSRHKLPLRPPRSSGSLTRQLRRLILHRTVYPSRTGVRACEERWC